MTTLRTGRMIGAFEAGASRRRRMRCAAPTPGGRARITSGVVVCVSSFMCDQPFFAGGTGQPWVSSGMPTSEMTMGKRDTALERHRISSCRTASCKPVNGSGRSPR
jgi:hypothetical protein